MFFNLDKLNIEEIDFIKYYNGITFVYNDKKYFFKTIKKNYEFYNELIAEKIANRLGISCCRYYLACYHNKDGVVSEYFEDPNYITMYDYLLKKYPEDEVDLANNLEDIWNAFYLDFNEVIVKKLMTELTNIFIFDAIIGNCDRNIENYGLVINGEKTHFAPLFDNEKLLSRISVKYGQYALEVESPFNEDFPKKVHNHLYQFLNVSDFSYHEKLKKALIIVSEEGIDEIFTELSGEDIEIKKSMQKSIRVKFANNREMINKYFDNKRKR